MNTTTVAVDLAKSVFQVCVLNERNQVEKALRLSREQFKAFLVTYPASDIVMEACYSAHYWGRYARDAGHQVRLIPAQHVTPFVRGNKNDRNDALAIAEASRRPGIRFVPVKSLAQQDIQVVHRIRERCVSARTTLCNQMRGLLSDYGHTFPVGLTHLMKALPELADQSSLSPIVKAEIQLFFEEYDMLSRRIAHADSTLKQYAARDTDCCIVSTVPGIGPHIASAIVATIGKGQAFENPRHFAVWTGLTPVQRASGNVSYIGRISKRGDKYLRKLLVQAAIQTARWAKRNPTTQLGHWINQIIARRGLQKGIVAVAHKLARIIWSMLHRQENFRAI